MLFLLLPVKDDLAPVSGPHAWRTTKKGPPLGPLSVAQLRVCARTDRILPGGCPDVKIHS